VHRGIVEGCGLRGRDVRVPRVSVASCLHASPPCRRPTPPLPRRAQRARHVDHTSPRSLSAPPASQKALCQLCPTKTHSHSLSPFLPHAPSARSFTLERCPSQRLPAHNPPHRLTHATSPILFHAAPLTPTLPSPFPLPPHPIPIPSQIAPTPHSHLALFACVVCSVLGRRTPWSCPSSTRKTTWTFCPRSHRTRSTNTSSR